MPSFLNLLTRTAWLARLFHDTNFSQGTVVAPPTQLAADLRARRAGVIDDLLATYGRELQGVAYLIVRNHADAEEITMDTLVSAWKHAGSLREDAALRAWLLRVATRHALARRRRHRPTQPLEALQPIRARSADQPSLDRMIVAEAMGELPPQMRAAVALRHYMGLSVPEVAQVMGKSVNTVKTHLREGRLITIGSVPRESIDLHPG